MKVYTTNIDGGTRIYFVPKENIKDFEDLLLGEYEAKESLSKAVIRINRNREVKVIKDFKDIFKRLMEEI